MSDPLVSVITASYNRSHYLPQTIESVLKQTYGNLEYILVDDGSTDDTKDVIKPYQEDRRFRYYFQANQGQSVARSFGLRVSKGEFLCFLDSDNLWEQDKIENQIEIFESHPDWDIVYGDIQHIDEGGNPLDIPNMKRHSGQITEKLLFDNFVTFNTAMFRRECYLELGGLDETIRRADDYEFWLRYSTRFEFRYIPKVYAKYRVMRDQISANKEARLEANRQIIEKFFEQYPEFSTDQIRKNTWCHFYTRRGRYRAMSSLYSQAFRDYFKAMTYNPVSKTPWRAFFRLILLWE